MKISAEATAAADEARKWGATDIRVSRTSRHQKVTFTYNGTQMFTIVPSTGGDRRGALNSRQDVRQMMGLERNPVKGERREPKDKAPPPRIEIPAITAGKDWQAPLRLKKLMAMPMDDVWRSWFRGILDTIP